MTDLLDAASSSANGSQTGRAVQNRTPGLVVIDELTPIDRYLRDQQTLTPVERFADLHTRLDATAPASSRYYRDLLPSGRPGAGQQYAFEVDLDACSGCKACVTACHSLNGLDDDEAWRSVGTLRGAGADEAVLQTVTTACHHCVDPACLSGCPVDAYEKDPLTGIVAHLDDQCIGCRYCTLTCPYEVPRFTPSRGIVRKCDLCADRLAEGEAPACVQGCPTSAIGVAIVDVDTLVEAAAAGGSLVPGAPSSALTIPSTTYRSSRPIPDALVAADHFAVRRASAHTPLAVMLVLTQLAVGAFAVDMVLRALAPTTAADLIEPSSSTVAVFAGVMALGASVLHLGRPAYAWRAVIGLRHSWLSREIVAFGGFAFLATADAVIVRTGAPTAVQGVVAAAVVAVGIGAVGCSVMIYAVTGRQLWRTGRVASKFVGTAVLTGAATVLLVALVASMIDRSVVTAVVDGVCRPLVGLVVVMSIGKLGAEVSLLRHRRDSTFTDLRRTAMLLTDQLRAVTAWRFALGVVGGVVAPLVVLACLASPQPAVLAATIVAFAMLVALIGGELCERWQFFTAVTSPRMPGDIE